jgi:predicted nucleotidyltransferase
MCDVPATALYLSDWTARFAARKSAAARDADARASAIQSCVPVLAETLVRDFGARRVWLIGSSARGEVHGGSDIDLVVEGLAPHLFVRAAAELDELAGPLAVDLIPLEFSTDRLRRDLARDGILLHAAG